MQAAARSGSLLAILALGAGCATRRACAPPAPTVSTTTTHYVFFNDAHEGSIVTRRENLFDRGLVVYDVRDLDVLHGAVEVILLHLPDLAREAGATHADLGGGALRVVGPPRVHALATELLVMLRASPGPRGPPATEGAVVR